MKRNNKTFFPVILIFVFIFACRENNENFFRVETGRFRVTITETGELQAVNSKVITMPSFDFDYGRPKITALAEEGKMVQTNDIVGQIDTSGVVRHLGQKKADLEIANADINKLDAQHDSKMKQLSAALESAEAALRMAVLDTQRVKFESESKREVSKLNYEIAKITLQKAQKKISHTKKIHAEENQIQQEKIKQIISAIKKAERTIHNFTLRAPAEGLLVHLKKGWRREKVRVGDQLWMGEPIIGLPDLSRMKVLTNVNETDIDKIESEQIVTVRLDAFPKKAFTGKITKVGRTCRKKDRDSKIKVFDVEILLQDSNPILRPGMTVSCEILVAELDDSLFVNNSCIHQTGDQFYVFVKDGAKLREIPITLGPKNNKSVVVTGDLKAGDKIINK
jgi:HlyD family secretion protein